MFKKEVKVVILWFGSIVLLGVMFPYIFRLVMYIREYFNK